ncbi:sporulation protein YabP [Sporanaerobacter acetigenes]|uniref:Sporulation protein YabP n=1 Tax=Sporanaerobacter acetigenes DSM 13106 TaxID=1123281 RepID=A0A1M5Y5Q8_9FIRM|nr:sporulation protein YabP [Sporanaerobacter acetigenes]SHI07415.1 sporulation protein YabP [Sporanaerobacter acetigenes DSM 13106]
MGENDIGLKNQNIYLEDRTNLTITGVEQVESFNDNTIILITIRGGMTIKGEELNINKLNLEDGNVKIDGTINGILYNNKDSNSKGKLFEKMFK